MILAWAMGASAADGLPKPPIEPVAWPVYEDATGAEVRWSEIRELARGTDARRTVRNRRLGRTVLRLTFAGVTAVEAWGTWELARNDNYLWAPLAGQTALTGTCAVLLWTRMPSDLVEDRALLLNAVNARLRVSR